MLHLINSVFASIDAMVDISVDRLVISKDYAVPMSIPIDDIAEGTLFGYATTYDELVGPGKRFPTLLSLLSFAQVKSAESGKEFVIYCDRQGMSDLATNFFRALLPNATSTDIFRIINSYQTRQRLKVYLWAGRYVAQNYTEILDELSVTSEDVNTSFVNSSIRAGDYTNFFSTNINGVGIEFLLATYARNGKNKNSVVNVLKDYICNELVVHASDVRDIIIENILDPKLRATFNLPADITLDTIESALTDPKNPVSTFFDPTIWNVPSYNYLYTYKDIASKLTPQNIQNIFTVFRIYRQRELLNWAGENADTTNTDLYLSMLENGIDNIINNGDWTSTISQLLNGDFNKNPLMSKIHSTVNIYLLDYICHAFRSNQSQLTPYLVNGSL